MQALLSDAGGVLYAQSLLDESIRLALAALRESSGEWPTPNSAGWTLQDLDGAPATTLPDAELNLLVIGAAACAVNLRSLQRFDRFELTPDLPARLLKWAEGWSAQFAQGLERTRLRALQSAAEPPYLYEEAEGWALE